MRFKYIVRRLLHSPMFTLITVATLAIGIGANTAIFSVIEGVLLKSLPYPHPEELIAVNHTAPGIGLKDAGAAPFLYFTYREQSRTFRDVAMWRTGSVSVTGLDKPEEVLCLNLTESALPILGVQPVSGRFFTSQDTTEVSPRTAILTYGYWQAKFGGEKSVLGKRIQLDGQPYEIIGVLPASFQFLDEKFSLVLPLRFDRAKVFLGNFSYSAIARMKAGVTLAQASADAERMLNIANHSFPPFPGFSVKMFEDAHLLPALKPLKEEFVGDIGKVLWVLMGTLGMVLLIACANVANLLLVRAEGRQQELAIRAALGAGWGEIAKELLVESVTLGMLGGLFGLGFAYAALRFLIWLAPAQLPRLSEIGIDATVLAFTLAISALASLLFGAIPILKYAGPNLITALRAGGRSLSQSKERHRARSTLVVVQIALALLLLISSGLMIRTFAALKNVQPGLTRPEEMLAVNVSIPNSNPKDKSRIIRTEQEIMNKLAAIPGVTSVAATSRILTAGQGWHDPIFAEDHTYASSKIPALRFFKFVTPDLLKTAGNRLIAGRDFTWTDTYEKRPVAMVSENLARELWQSPGAALGKRIRENLNGPWREVVGVVADERDDGVNKPPPATAYFPVFMDNFEGNEVQVLSSPYFLIRSLRAGSQGFLNDVSQAIWSVNSDLPLASVRTVQEIYTKSMARTSFTLVMLAMAGGMALLLGVVGIYGVISYSVSQRTREIGIRMALGSPTGDLTRMFVGHGLRLAAIGIGCGLTAALALMRLMSSLLFEVNPMDPATYAAVSLGLVVAAALASYLPALRAATIDPMVALRTD